VTSERDLRWNFIAALIDAVGWGLGMGLVSATTFLPMFVRELSGSTLAVGMVSAGMTLGWYVPGILVARYVERLTHVRRYVITLALLERLFLLLVVPLIYLCGNEHRGAALSGFLICWFLMNLSMGCNSPSYYKLIAKTIPAERRGRLYGIGGALAGLLGVGAGLASGELIARWGYPHGYALCFLAAGFVLVATVIPLGFVREEAHRSHSKGEKEAEVAERGHSPWKALRRDGGLRWLTISHVLFSGSLMMSGFLTDYAIVRFHAGPRTVAYFTTAVMAAQVFASLLCGWLGDRYGNKRALQIATGCGAAAALLAAAAPSLAFFYPIFALNQIATTGWGIAAFNLLLELGGQERAATYTAVSTLLTGPFKAGMPILGAALIRGLGETPGSWLANGFGYVPVFVLAAGITTIGLVALTRGVAEPRESVADRAPSTEHRAPSAALTAEEGAAA
jgi:MFS family permease